MLSQHSSGMEQSVKITERSRPSVPANVISGQALNVSVNDVPLNNCSSGGRVQVPRGNLNANGIGAIKANNRNVHFLNKHQ